MEESRLPASSYWRHPVSNQSVQVARLPVFPGTINTLYFSLGYANEIGIEREAHHQFFYTIPVVARFPRSRADYAVFRYEALLYTTPLIDRISDRNQPEITGLNGKVVQVC
jgi:hypothetical protein